MISHLLGQISLYFSTGCDRWPVLSTQVLPVILSASCSRGVGVEEGRWLVALPSVDALDRQMKSGFEASVRLRESCSPPLLPRHRKRPPPRARSRMWPLFILTAPVLILAARLVGPHPGHARCESSGRTEQTAGTTSGRCFLSVHFRISRGACGGRAGSGRRVVVNFKASASGAGSARSRASSLLQPPSSLDARSATTSPIVQIQPSMDRARRECRF